MKTLSLLEYIESGKTQQEVAKLMGKTQGAVSQMLRNENREIFILLSHDDEFVAWEERKLYRAS